MAELCAHEWKRERDGDDAIGFVKEINSIRALRENHVAEARVWASNLDLRAENFRKACLSFPSTTAIGLDQHAFTDIALLPDNPLESLGEIIRQCFFKLAISTQPLLQLLVLLGKKMEEAELSPSCTQHIASPCVWYQHTSVNGMSSLQVNGTLRSRVTQRSEHMLRGRWASSWPTASVHMWSIFSGTCRNSMTASKHIFSFRSWWPIRQRIQRHHQWLCIQHFGRLSPELLLGQRTFVWSGPTLGYVVTGSVCEEHIDDLSQCVTNASRIRMFQDAALIGKAVKEGTAKLCLNLSCKSNAPGKRQIPGKADRWSSGDEGVPICLGTSATDLGIETAAGKRRCAANQWKRIGKADAGPRVNRLRKMNSEAQKLTMTGTHPVQIYGHTAQGASTTQVNAMCKKPQNTFNEKQNPSK